MHEILACSPGRKSAIIEQAIVARDLNRRLAHPVTLSQVSCLS